MHPSLLLPHLVHIMPNGDYGPTREYMSLFISNRSINKNHGYYQDEDNQDHVQPLRHHSSAPKTYFERDYDTTSNSF